MIRADFLRTVVLAPIAALFGRRAQRPPALDMVAHPQRNVLGQMLPEGWSTYEVRAIYVPAQKTITWSYQQDPTRW